MTRFDPSIVLNRLIVVQGKERAYDETFHLGVNIIRNAPGFNSVGKSTIANMIFYALGGDGVRWVQEALSCDSVIAAVTINGTALTLQRDISPQRERPMRIFWGDFAGAESSSPSDWQTYPFSARGSVQSFSQVLFRVLGIPEVKGELAARLTMNQLLRLMFADQSTPGEEMYRHEEFTRKETLDAVGSLLCGIYDDRIYEIGIEIRAKQGERDQIQAQLKAVWKILGTTDQAEGLSVLLCQLEDARTKLQAAYKQLALKRSGQWNAADADAKEHEIKATAVELEVLNSELNQLDTELRSLTFEIEDSAQFIAAMESNRDSLSDSVSTRVALGELQFRYCPACLAEIARHDGQEVCPLCKLPMPAKAEAAHFARLRQELNLQLNESLKLQAIRIARRVEISDILPVKAASKNALMLKYNDLATSVTTRLEDILAHYYQEIGYLTREIEDLEKQVQLARSLDRLEEQKACLEQAISRLTDEKDRRETAKEHKQKDAYSSIKQIVADLINADLPMEDAFQNATVDDINFDFAENGVTVAGRTNFSASSTVILKNSFHIALLLASTQKQFFRYPRFALFDNIEDKGMIQERSHNFQQLIVRMSDAASAEHQIIMTTSVIDPGLEQSKFTIGEAYSRDNKSLRVHTNSLHPATPI